MRPVRRPVWPTGDPPRRSCALGLQSVEAAWSGVPWARYAAGLTIEDEIPHTRVYDHPATQFVAEFLGTCNILPVSSNGTALTLPDGGAVEVANANDSGVLTRGVRVGIRPEKLTLVPNGGAGVRAGLFRHG